MTDNPWETVTQYGSTTVSYPMTREAYRIACLIERCGASEALTAASSAAFDFVGKVEALSSRLDALQKEHDALIHDHERAMTRECNGVNQVAELEDELAEAKKLAVYWMDNNNAHHKRLVEAESRLDRARSLTEKALRESLDKHSGTLHQAIAAIQESLVEKPAPIAPIERPPIEPDDDGHCRRCGILWEEEERVGYVEHECPPGFLV